MVKTPTLNAHARSCREGWRKTFARVTETLERDAGTVHIAGTIHCIDNSLSVREHGLDKEIQIEIDTKIYVHKKIYIERER